MAVPGHPFDARASGCNMLIRDGALLIRGASDAPEALGSATAPDRISRNACPFCPAPEAPQRPLKEVAVLHSMILARAQSFGRRPASAGSERRADRLAPELLTLELDGRIARQPGGLLTRIN